MEKSLLQHFEKNDQTALKKKLDEININQLQKVIRQLAVRGKKECFTLLQAIFFGSQSSSDTCISRRYETYKFAISLLQSADLNSRLATDIVGMLLFETDALPTSRLMQLADTLVDLVKKCTMPGGKWLDIVSKVLTSLASRSSVVHEGKEMPGVEFKSQVVNSLCSSRWEPSCVVQLASIFREIPLSSAEILFVIEKLLRTLPDIGIQEIPPLIYQLLLLSAKGPRKQVLLGILNFFINQDDKLRHTVGIAESEESELIENPNNGEALWHAEGTVILHITFAARQDQNLGREFIKIIKTSQHSGEFVMSPFTFSVALSLAKVQRYEERILDVLKGAVLKTFRQKVKKCQSEWVRDIIPSDPDLFILVSEAIKNSKHGWDHVTQGLVLFGFALLDSFGPKGVFGRITYKTSPISAVDHASSLGAHTLKETFKAHHIVRSEIFEQILNRVIMKSSSPVLHYIDVLTKTVQSAPQLLLEILSKLKEIMDYLPFLPHVNAVGVLQSLTPLLKISMPLKDTLMIVLRKALFNREIETRKIAVSGYLIVLKNLKIMGNISLSQSQNSQSSSSVNTVQIDVHVNHNCNNSEAVCLEIMGTLKRALMQQSDVRKLLYEGLYDVVVKNNRILDIVLELLLYQFEKFYDGSEDSVEPLKFGLCICKEKNGTDLQEPLADLLTAIHLCLAEGKKKAIHDDSDTDSEDQQNSRTMFEISLKSMMEKMLDCEPEDFELDGSSDFNPNSAVGARNKLIATLLLGTYEALMEYSLMKSEKYSENMCKEILSLFHNHLKILNLMQDKKHSRATKSKKKEVKNFDTHLTIRFVSDIVNAVFTDEDPDHDKGLSLLRADRDFVEHIVFICNQKLVKHKDSGKLDGFSSNMENKFECLCIIAKVYLDVYANDSSSVLQSSDVKCLSLLFIEGLNHLFSTVFSSYHHKITKFLEMLVDNSDMCSTNNGDSELMIQLLKRFQSFTIDTLADIEDDSKLKELPPLLSIIGLLWEHLPPSHKYRKNVYQWIRQLCSEQSLRDVSCAKALLSLCLNLNHEVENCGAVLGDMAFDTHFHLGDLEEDVDVDGNRQYEIINPKTAECAISLILHHTEKLLDEIDWVLNAMKASITAVESSKTNISNRKENEKKICTRLGSLISIFHEVVQTAVPRGNLCNVLLKLVTKFYTTFADLAKYYLSLYRLKIGKIDGKFEKVVKLSGTHLTSQVYAFITYIQPTENDTDADKTKPKKSSTIKYKILKEIKTVPTLIFAIEVYEKYLIQLSKKSQINLMEHIKLSTSRDFRINAEIVPTLEQNMNSDSDETNAEREDLENVVPPSDDETASVGDISTSVSHVLENTRSLSKGQHMKITSGNKGNVTVNCSSQQNREQPSNSLSSKRPHSPEENATKHRKLSKSKLSTSRRKK